ncbi:MAG: Mrp/NBP35 family ATP-binding protein [Phycisphaerales bacterium]|nr:Mrp/NBP35 family ATP-binding protein [Phycisphaerales bacterium]
MSRLPSEHPIRPQALSGIKNIIVVGSGKGGVGKSTISTLLAVGLTHQGLRVGLLDADIYGPSIPQMLGVCGAQPVVRADQIIPVDVAGLQVVSIGFLVAPEKAVIWRGPMIHNTIKQFIQQVAWGDLDYLIVDLPPGTGDVPLTLAQTIPMTGAVIVCTPQAVALADALRATRMYRQLNVQILGLIENMSYFIAPDTGREYDLFGKGGAELATTQMQIPFLGSIPINIAIRLSGDRGAPMDIFEKDPQGVGQAVALVIKNLLAQVDSIPPSVL